MKNDKVMPGSKEKKNISEGNPGGLNVNKKKGRIVNTDPTTPPTQRTKARSGRALQMKEQ